MSTNTAIVDERDALIQYAGTWNDAGSFIEFAKTTKWSSAEGSTATFSFVGSSVTVYGSVGADPASASLSFAVDGSTLGSYTTSSGSSGLFHEALFTSPTMPEQSHTLVITQTAAQSSSGPIYLDYIMFQTTSSSPGASFFIDDRDPRITYTPAWRQFGSQNDFQHTSSESTSPGDSFSFEFEGSAISYYGGLTTSDTGASIASIVFDDGAPVSYTAPNPIPATANNLIFEANNLSAGKHTLVVTSTNTDTLWMDYFLVSPNPSSGTSSPGSPTSGPGSPATSPGTSVGGSTAKSGSTSVFLSAPSSASTHPSGISDSSVAKGTSNILSTSTALAVSAPVGSSSSSVTFPVPVSAAKSKPTAAIAGGVIGGLILFALLLTTFFLCRRRCRRARAAVALPKEDPLAARPFTNTTSTSYGSSEVNTPSPYPPTDTLWPTPKGARVSQFQSQELAEDLQRHPQYTSTAELIPPRTLNTVNSSIFPPSEEAPPQYSA